MIKIFAELVEQAQKLEPARVVVIEAHNLDVLESLKDAESLGQGQSTCPGAAGHEPATEVCHSQASVI
jgi:hypothetical protein